MRSKVRLFAAGLAFAFVAAGAVAQTVPPSILDESGGPATGGTFPPARAQPAPRANPPAPAPAPRAEAPGAPSAGSGANRPLPAELDSERQTRGELPPIKRSADLSLPLGQIQPAWTDAVAAPGQVSPGILRVRYERNKTFQLRTRVMMTTTIQLPACEQIEDLYIGDGYTFQVKQSRDNVVVVRPNQAGADTSLTIVSSAGNTYTFYMRSETVETKTVSDLSVFVEAPGLCRAAPGQAVRPTILGSNGEMVVNGRGRAGRPTGDFVREIGFDFSKVDFDCCRIYAETQADAAIAPVRVFSDDIHTYVDFGERADRISSPAAFLLRDGIDQPVNTRVVGSRGQILVVEALGDITLKSGERVICIRRVKDADAIPASVTIDPNAGRKARKIQ